MISLYSKAYYNFNNKKEQTATFQETAFSAVHTLMEIGNTLDMMSLSHAVTVSMFCKG